MRLAIIPARGGSQRIKKKNIRDFCGKPIVAWSIEAALSSGVFDEVAVTTDSPDIKEVAESYGATVPFERPAHLADNFATARAAFYHCLSYYLEREAKVECAMLLYATAPMVTGERLAESLRAWQATDFEKAMAVAPFSYPPQRGFTLDDQNRICPPDRASLGSRTQDLPTVYHDAAQFYFLRVRDDGTYSEERFIAADTFPIVVPHYLVQDIDEPDDWTRAEGLFRALGRAG